MPEARPRRVWKAAIGVRRRSKRKANSSRYTWKVVVADAVVGAGEPSLEVAKDPMAVRQELGRPGGGSLRARTMTVPQVAERGIGLPRISQDESAGGDGALHEARQRARRGIRHDVESDATGGRPAHFHRADDQRLVQELAAALQADLGAPEIGLIHLDLVLQRLPLGVHHGPPQLVQQGPGSLIADPKLAVQ